MILLAPAAIMDRSATKQATSSKNVSEPNMSNQESSEAPLQGELVTTPYIEGEPLPNNAEPANQWEKDWDYPHRFKAADGTYTSETQRRLHRVDKIAWVMDAAVRIPGTKIRLGLDSVIGLIPGIGDIASIAIGAVLFREAVKLEASAGTLIKMVGNLAVDALVGIIPIFGDLFDVAFRANARNAKLLAKHVRERDGHA